MKKHQMRLGTVIKALCLLSVISASEVYAASLDDVLGVRSSTTVEGAKSQAKIDEVTEQTRDLLQQFKTVMKVVDGLQVYNQQQRRLIKNQEDELGELEESIDNVTVIERQIRLIGLTFLLQKSLARFFRLIRLRTLTVRQSKLIQMSFSWRVSPDRLTCLSGVEFHWYSRHPMQSLPASGTTRQEHGSCCLMSSGLAYVTGFGLLGKPRLQISSTYPYRLQENNP